MLERQNILYRLENVIWGQFLLCAPCKGLQALLPGPGSNSNPAVPQAYHLIVRPGRVGGSLVHGGGRWSWGRSSTGGHTPVRWRCRARRGEGLGHASPLRVSQLPASEHRLCFGVPGTAPPGRGLQGPRLEGAGRRSPWVSAAPRGAPRGRPPRCLPGPTHPGPTADHPTPGKSSSR